MPENTKTVPSHCLVIRLLPKKMTEARMVKNFRVVVMIEHGSGPKSVTHRKMKNCPRALATDNAAKSQRTEG